MSIDTPSPNSVEMQCATALVDLQTQEDKASSDNDCEGNDDLEGANQATVLPKPDQRCLEQLPVKPTDFFLGTAEVPRMSSARSTLALLLVQGSRIS